MTGSNEGCVTGRSNAAGALYRRSSSAEMPASATTSGSIQASASMTPPSKVETSSVRFSGPAK
jgi:hypothetical protein